MGMRTIAVAALAVCVFCGPAAMGSSDHKAESSNDSSSTKSALEALKAGGKTLAGPGTYIRQANLSDVVVQLTDPTNVCATVTLVQGTSVQLNLRDGANNSLQSATANTNLRTAACCANGTVRVELLCGSAACQAVWRVDAR